MNLICPSCLVTTIYYHLTYYLRRYSPLQTRQFPRTQSKLLRCLKLIKKDSRRVSDRGLSITLIGRSALCDQAIVENKNENESLSTKTGLSMNQTKKGSSTNELLVRAFIESAKESKKVTTAIDQLSHLPGEVAALNEKIENLETFRRETMTILENYHLTQIHLSHLQNQLAMREQQIDFMYRSLANVNSKFRLMLQSLAQKDNRIFEGFQVEEYADHRQETEL
ncbi:uncharacterized protein BP01DRAFT_188309 [Aspergillus saccharolyticus JOP 1030-1]|uniref:Uncharacterized protein n=1 Tax=Aspergillus saccharolyticus JOP 1030-1 TaxID=1450539 RepID=A0A318Z3K4_9EURO|nr:hypothetical protein BP01DRAFT_188309 [Aspergillus saccharolyticus JOP 1030-1]PYH40994.1 hypothetical protein BP01DRAFT_188309 [Aspergillus saccharolyticus JOP 1030-1]